MLVSNPCKQTAPCENRDCASTEIESMCFTVARWGSWMQLLLTTDSFWGQPATILIKTGIWSKAIHGWTKQTHACMQDVTLGWDLKCIRNASATDFMENISHCANNLKGVLLVVFYTVRKYDFARGWSFGSQGDELCQCEWPYQRKFEIKIEARETSWRAPNNGVSPPLVQKEFPICVYLFLQVYTKCVHVHCHFASGRDVSGMNVTHGGVCILSSPPPSRLKGPRSTFGWCNSRKTGASCCLQLEVDCCIHLGIVK